MKNYFPDDPDKQEMLEHIVNEYKHLCSGCEQEKYENKISQKI